MNGTHCVGLHALQAYNYYMPCTHYYVQRSLSGLTAVGDSRHQSFKELAN